MMKHGGGFQAQPTGGTKEVNSTTSDRNNYQKGTYYQKRRVVLATEERIATATKGVRTTQVVLATEEYFTRD